jgi:hypothetical protein
MRLTRETVAHCDSCPWFHPFDTDVSDDGKEPDEIPHDVDNRRNGVCRRKPPTVILTGNEDGTESLKSVWPITGTTSYCSFHPDNLARSVSDMTESVRDTAATALVADNGEED